MCTCFQCSLFRPIRSTAYTWTKTNIIVIDRQTHEYPNAIWRHNSLEINRLSDSAIIKLFEYASFQWSTWTLYEYIFNERIRTGCQCMAVSCLRFSKGYSLKQLFLMRAQVLVFQYDDWRNSVHTVRYYGKLLERANLQKCFQVCIYIVF